MIIRISAIVFLTIILSACAPSIYMTRFDDDTLILKEREIAGQPERLARQTDKNPNQLLSQIYNRLEPWANKICVAIGERWLESSCKDWKIEIVNEDSFNAAATGDGRIIFHDGVFKYARSEGEIAFVMGHEMAHHILNHHNEDRVNGAAVGVMTGILTGLVVGVVGKGMGVDSDTLSEIISDAAETGFEQGNEVGRRIFSVDQEAEADRLSLRIVTRAGYKISEARNLLLYLASNNELNGFRSSPYASHPTGPERLAAFDHDVASAKASPKVNVLARRNETVEWTKAAANLGLKEAQFNLGMMYISGKDVPQNDEEAVKWLSRAAERGHINAQYNLAVLYYSGEAIAQNFEEAVKWFRVASDQGSANAQYNLGVVYNNGKGVRKDLNEAVKWYLLAAEQGHINALKTLKTLHEPAIKSAR